MSSYAERLFGGTPKKDAQRESYAQRLFQQPEYGPIEPQEGSAGFMANLKAGMVSDMETKKRLYAKSLFPNEPDAVDRFQVLNGEIVYRDDNGQLRDVDSRLVDKAGKLVSYAPELVGGIAGSMAGSPVVGGALGATAGRAGKQLIANLLFDEPQSPQTNAMQLGGEFAANYFGGMAFNKLARLYNTRVGMNEANLNVDDLVRRQQEVFRNTGVRLDFAQLSDMEYMRALKEWSSRFPNKASQVIEASDEIINGQSEAAVNRVIATLSKGLDPDALGVRGMNAARATIDTLKTARELFIAPMYEQAFKAGGQVDARPALTVIDDALKTAKDSVRATLERARRSFFVEGKVGGKKTQVMDTSVEGLHGTKRALDALIAKAKQEGNPAVAELIEARRALLGSIEEASPQYRQAMDAYRKFTQERIRPVQESIIGSLANMSEQSAGVVSRIIQGQSVPAEAIRRARAQMVKLGDVYVDGELVTTGREAWDGLAAQWLANNLNKALKVTQTGETRNMAGKFYQAVFGSPAQREQLMALFDGNTATAMGQVLDALKMVASTSSRNSQTEFNRLISEQMSARGAKFVRWLTAPRGTAISIMDDTALQGNAIAISEALTDPAKLKQLRLVRRMKPGTERALTTLGIIFGQSTGNALENL